MISQTDIEKLAKLSRINLSDAEKSQFGKEIDSILGYVSEIKAAAKESRIHFSNKNVLREDIAVDSDPEPILKEAPDREGDFIAVKKILG